MQDYLQESCEEGHIRNSILAINDEMEPMDDLEPDYCPHDNIADHPLVFLMRANFWFWLPDGRPMYIKDVFTLSEDDVAAVKRIAKDMLSKLSLRKDALSKKAAKQYNSFVEVLEII